MNSDSQSDIIKSVEALGRLAEMGIEVRSVEMHSDLERYEAFVKNGGNRAMRRAAKRAKKSR